MVLFILFPGMGESGKYWEKYIDWDKKKVMKTSFLQKLKKLGNVYTYTPNVYNIINNCVCDYDCRLNKKVLYSNPNQLTMNDIHIDSECKRIYEEIKSYKGKLIPIGHSAGGWFAVRFTKLYQSRCIKTILIESGYLTQKRAKRQIESKTKKHTYPNMTTNKLQLLVNKLQTNRNCKHKLTKDLEHKLTYIYMYCYHRDVKKINGKLPKPTLLFENIKVTNNSKEDNESNKKQIEYQNELYKKNGKNVNFINLVNTNHYPWFIPKYSDEMIRQIKCFIE